MTFFRCSRAYAWLACLALAAFPCYGWFDAGHMTVAYIAYKNLTPRVRARVDALLKLNPMYAGWTNGVPDTGKGLTAFVRASTWADCIKNARTCPGYTSDGPDGGNTPPPGPDAARNIGYSDKLMHKYWHFVDKPFSTAGVEGEQPKTPNAETEIPLLAAALRTKVSAGIKSYDIVWLEHIAGDVHQPLHCVSRYTRNHPNGDRGGNDVAFCQAPCRDVLHAYWDGLLGDKPDMAAVVSMGDELLSRPKPPGAGELNAAVWTSEAFALAKSVAYAPPISPDNDPSGAISPRPGDAYRAAALELARSQALLAGYRLAALLNANLK